MGTIDPTSRRWIAHLREGHPARDRAIGALHDLLRRAAVHELARRRTRLGQLAGPEFDDLAEQAADDALVNVLGRLEDFEGRSRFTTWAYKFVIFEVSSKVSRHRWQRQPPSDDERAFDRLPDRLAPRPEDRVAQREQLATLSRAIADLTERQRDVFVSIALNDEPIDVVVARLGTNRNAVYKNLFDARRRLRGTLAVAGLGVGEDAPEIAASRNAAAVLAPACSPRWPCGA